MSNVLDIARYIINYSNSKNYSISNLRLQKLLYFLQAYYLVLTDSHDPCFNEEIEAWDFGPVVPTVYHEFKCFGSGNIPTINSYILFDNNNIWSSRRIPFDKNIIPKSDRLNINDVIDKFSAYSTTQLVTLTHNQQPWKKAYDNSESKIISKQSIKEYFKID